MSLLPLQVINIVASLAIFTFVAYYFFQLGKKETDLNKKERQTDTDYHQAVSEALAKERKILQDATSQADQIIANAKQISQSVRDEVNQALQLMVVDIQKEASNTASSFTANYQSSLKQISTQSLQEFNSIAKSLETDLQNQIKQFHDVLLPGLQKELDEYKRSRMAETDRQVARIIKRAAQEIMNKSISLEDHLDLVTDSLEKAKKQGAFD